MYPALALIASITVLGACKARPSADTQLLSDSSQQGLLCSDPYAVLCDPNTNPYVAKVLRARAYFEELEEKAGSEIEVLQFINQRPQDQGGTGRYCFELQSTKDYLACALIRTKYVKRYIYTPERSAKAQQLFERAKYDMIAYLTRRMELLPAMGAKDTVGVMSSMIAQIRKTRVFLGDANEDGKDFSFNAAQVNLIPASQRSYTLWDQLSNSKRNYNPYVYIEGYILLTDEAPESVYNTMLHELGHVIDPDSFSTSGNSNNPFRRDLLCLERPDTIASRPTDFACLEAWARRLASRGSPVLARLLENSLAELRTNPNKNVYLPPLPEGEESCQQAQLGEAFADWIAAEAGAFAAGAGLLPKDAAPTQKSLKRRDEIFQIAALRCGRDPKTPEGREILFKDSHPLPSDRLRKLFMASPYVRGALGCYSNEAYVPIRNLNQPVKEGTIGMCGMWQYLPLDLGQ
jgi:hypothetical protein